MSTLRPYFNHSFPPPPCPTFGRFAIFFCPAGRLASEICFPCSPRFRRLSEYVMKGTPPNATPPPAPPPITLTFSRSPPRRPVFAPLVSPFHPPRCLFVRFLPPPCTSLAFPLASPLLCFRTTDFCQIPGPLFPLRLAFSLCIDCVVEPSFFWTLCWVFTFYTGSSPLCLRRPSN